MRRLRHAAVFFAADTTVAGSAFSRVEASNSPGQLIATIQPAAWGVVLNLVGTAAYMALKTYTYDAPRGNA